MQWEKIFLKATGVASRSISVSYFFNIKKKKKRRASGKQCKQVGRVQPTAPTIYLPVVSFTFVYSDRIVLSSSLPVSSSGPEPDCRVPLSCYLSPLKISI